MIDDASYFARYPNNQFWLMILIWLFRLVRMFVSGADMEVLKNISIVVSCILVQLTIFIVYRTVRWVWNEKKAFHVGIMAVLFLPLYLFAQFAYTDTSGMLVCALLMYLYVGRRQAGGWQKKMYLILLGFTAALAYEVKVTVFIVFIAIVADSITRIQNMKKYAVCVVMVMSVAAITALSMKKAREEQPLLFTRIAIFGFCLFMCIWECNARYMVALLPIFIITSADGFRLLSEKLQREKKRNGNKS